MWLRELMTIDIVNGTLEWIGAFVIFLSVKDLYRQKYATGVSPLQFGFFMVWGFWNIFYYPQLDQWWSMVGGIAVVSMNTLWLGLYIYYERRLKKLARDVAFGKQKLYGYGSGMAPVDLTQVEVDELDHENECPECGAGYFPGPTKLSEKTLDIQKRRMAPECFQCSGDGYTTHELDGQLQSVKCKRCAGTGHE